MAKGLLLQASPAVALLLALSVAGGPGLADPPESAASAGFQVYHYASEVEGTAFREVFLVHAVDLGLVVQTRDVQVLLEGQPLDVAWEDPDGLLGVGDRFSFVQEAFDQKQVLTATVGGQPAMECMFGGGAGISITPEEWREMGLGDAVRCLQLTDDQ